MEEEKRAAGRGGNTEGGNQHGKYYGCMVAKGVKNLQNSRKCQYGLESKRKSGRWGVPK